MGLDINEEFLDGMRQILRGAGLDPNMFGAQLKDIMCVLNGAYTANVDEVRAAFERLSPETRVLARAKLEDFQRNILMTVLALDGVDTGSLGIAFDLEAAPVPAALPASAPITIEPVNIAEAGNCPCCDKPFSEHEECEHGGPRVLCLVCFMNYLPGEGDAKQA